MTLNQPTKKKFPRHQAISVAREIVQSLKPDCENIAVAGSLRRGKEQVSDCEILYIPRFRAVKRIIQGDLLDAAPPNLVNMADELLAVLLNAGVIEKRCNMLGHEIWGEKNKLARHAKTRIPIDFFSATEKSWWSLLVCRTGGAQSNIEICEAAQKKGFRWSPYEGFWDPEGNMVRAVSEEDVFRLVGLPWKEPKDRL